MTASWQDSSNWSLTYLHQNRGGNEQYEEKFGGALLAFFDERVECVLFNARYSKVQANAMVENINDAIGMSHENSD